MFDLIITAVNVLDSLPAVIRTMLSASVFAGLLCYIGSRIPSEDAPMMVSYRKVALVAMLAMPVLTHWVLNWRLVVLVEEMPDPGGAPLLMRWVVAGLWSAGVVWYLLAGLREAIELAARYRELEPMSNELARRIVHWQRRLSVRRQVRVGFGDAMRPLSYGYFRPVIVLPRAVAHWPGPTQDVMLLGALAHIKRGNWKWLVLGQLVASLYWPVPWVRKLVGEFNLGFERTSDALAMSCFQDVMGFKRALSHAHQRLTGAESERCRPSHLGWADGGSVEEREQYLASTLRDPSYDRVFWSMIPALAFLILISHTTLEEYQEIEQPALVLAEDWQTGFGLPSDFEEVKVNRKRRWVVLRKPRARYHVPDVSSKQESNPGN